jgi:hypothetical protein
MLQAERPGDAYVLRHIPDPHGGYQSERNDAALDRLD